MELYFVLLVGIVLGIAFKDKILKSFSSASNGAGEISYEVSRLRLEQKVKKKDIDGALNKYISNLLDELLKYEEIEEDEAVQYLENNMERVKYEFVHNGLPGECLAKCVNTHDG